MDDEEAAVVRHCPATACRLLQKQLVDRSRNSHVGRKTTRESECCCRMALLPDYCSRRPVVESGMALHRCAVDIAVNSPASVVKAGCGTAPARSKPRDCRTLPSSPSLVLRQQKQRRHRQREQQQQELLALQNPQPPCFSAWPITMKPEPEGLAEHQACCESPTHARSAITEALACPPPPSKPARKPRNVLHSSSSSSCRRREFFIPSNLDELPPFLQSLFA